MSEDNVYKLTSELTPLEKLRHAAQMKTAADKVYEDTIFFCLDSGIAKAKIARELGVTEAAIRMRVKRRK